MKKNNFYTIFCLLLFSFLGLKAQYNLIENPGFDNYPSLITCNHSPNTNFTADAAYWSAASPWIIPQKKVICIINHVGTPDILCDNVHSLPAKGFGGEFEYINAPLLIGLVTGRTYYFECWVNSSIETGRGGVLFFNNRPHQCSAGGFLKEDRVPYIPIPDNTLGQWQKVTSYYTATDNFSWISAGIYNTLNARGGVQWDDFKLIDVGGFCSPYNYIQNITFDDIHGIIYRSSVLTSSGKNVIPSPTNTPQGNAIVKSNSEVTYRSAVEVALMDGFSAEDGSIFNAVIAPCNQDCPQIIADAGGTVEACSSAPVQLGSNSILNQTYLWASNNSSNLNYLSATNISNPVFTPPAGSGSIQYTLTATNPCGKSSSDNVVVYYDDTPDPNPSGVVFPNHVTGYTADFLIAGNSHTEEVDVDVFDVDINDYVGHYEITNFPQVSYIGGGPGSLGTYNHHYDFSTSPDVYNLCHHYQLQVTFINICSNNVSPTQIVDWDPNSNITVNGISNFLYPNQPDPGDQFCVNVNGATSCDLDIYATQGGNLVHHLAGVPLTDGFNCLWDGLCDAAGTPSTCSPLGGLVNDGNYSYVITFKNCKTQVGASGYLLVTHTTFRIANPNASNPTDSIVRTIANISEMVGEPLIYPNPTNGVFTLVSDLTDQNSKYEIIDAYGKVIQSNLITSQKMNLQISESGVYQVRIITHSSTITKKLVVQY